MPVKEESKKTLEFTDDFVEKLILNRTMHNKEYMAFFETMFDKRWIVDNKISVILSMALSYYKAYKNIPSENIMTQLIHKVCEKKKESSDEYIIAYNECRNNEVFDVDEECAKSNILFYIKNKATYYAIFDNVEDIEKKDISKCQERLEKISTLSFDSDDFFNYFEELDQHIDYIKNPESRLPMGIRFLDDITNGGLFKDGKCLAVFMAQPGLGKSLMLANIAYRMLKNNNTVLVISCEMSKDVYGRRFDALISDDNIDALQYTYESSFSKVRHFKETHPDAKLIIKEFPPRTISSIDIKLCVEKLIAKNIIPNVIVVDYLNLVLPNVGTHDDTSYSKILEVGENLRALSYMFKCPVITATQTNSEGINNADVGLQHTSESRGTGHTGDFIVALYQLTEDIELGIINAKILKNRLGGKHGKVHPLKLNPKTLKIEDEMSDAIVIDSDGNPQDSNNNVPNDIDDMLNFDV